MAELLSLGKRTRALSAKALLNEALNDTEIKEFLLSLNTNEQLFDKGIDSKGKDLKSIGGDYAPITKKIKLSKGQPADRVTLKDTGDMYESGKVSISGTTVTLTFDTINEGVDLTKRWGNFIIGLTNESKKKAEARILQKVLEILLQSFFR